jgi:hypothetical protein
MKRILIASAVALYLAAPSAALADAPAVPPAKCEPKPEYPGKLALQSENRVKSFRKELDAYKDCVNAYLADRKAAMKANEDASNALIAEYNAVMKKINEAQTASKDD